MAGALAGMQIMERGHDCTNKLRKIVEDSENIVAGVT
jgi:hypothetical protein